MLPRRWGLAALAAIGGLALWVQASTVQADGGIGPGDNLWAAWNANPLPSLALCLVAYLYLNGLSRWPQPSHPVNRWQKISFFTGLFTIFLALQSPIDALAQHQLSIHQVQHLILRMIGPLLVLAGAPLTPILRGLPRWALQGVIKSVVRNSFARRFYDFLTNPVVTTVLFLGILYVWQAPFLHNLAIRNELVHAAMHSNMLFSGFLFWWLVVDPKPHRSRLHYGLRILYLGLIVIPNTLLGAGITFNTNLIYDAYYDFPQPFTIPPLIDQQVGGLLLWMVGDMMSILIAGFVMMLWYRQEQARGQDEWDPAVH